MRLLLRSGDHSILRTPAPSCILLPPTKQVEDRVFACAGRADPTPRPIWAMSALLPKADMCFALAYFCFGPIADMRAFIHSTGPSARLACWGTLRPSALAVLRLITSSYLVGACTGRSAGFSPSKMRST